MEHQVVNKPINSLIRRLKNGKINVNPDYQRNSVWTKPQKRNLIDSLIEGIPIPALYFNKIDDDKFDVVDGQQRLRTIEEFMNDEFSINEDSQFGSRHYSELDEEIKDRIEDYQLTIVELRYWDKDEIEDMFLRLQDGTPLNAPEKRRAIKGTFRDVVAELSKSKFFENYAGYDNNRYGYEDSIAKSLHLMINDMGPITPQKIKVTYQTNNKIKIEDDLPASLRKAIKFWEKAFDSEGVNPKMKKWATIFLPLVINEIRNKFEIKGHEKLFAEAYFSLIEKVENERVLPEDQQDQRTLNFIDAIRGDDPLKLKYRFDYINEFILESIPQLEAKVERDSDRIFNSDQRVILYRKSKGICQKCGVKINQNDFDADHIVRHADGGKTTIENGRALCVNCNRSGSKDEV